MLKGHPVRGATSILSGIAQDMSTKLLGFGLLSPLTGNNDEWTKIADRETMQNVRYPLCFRTKDGIAYIASGFLFNSPDEPYPYALRCSYRIIKFPATEDDLKPVYFDIQKADGMMGREAVKSAGYSFLEY